MTLRSLWMTPLLTMAIGCATESIGPIDYVRSGGIGGDSTTLHIEPDGTMTRTRNQHAPEITQLADSTMTELRQKIDAADLGSLDDEYTCNCADDYEHRVSVVLGGSLRTVTADEMADKPGRLEDALEALEALARPNDGVTRPADDLR